MRENTTKGLIVKALGGFYYVETAGGVLVECRARGLFRKNEESPLVGDQVEMQLEDEQHGYVVSILPRKNDFLRPPIANVQKLFLVVSTAEPVPSTLVIDKLAAIATYKDITPVLVITKTDLCSAKPLEDIYSRAGIDVFCVCNTTGEGVQQVLGAMGNGINVLTGNSGVGKSSLLNWLGKEYKAPTAQISQKLGRGRHTTRHVQLYKLATGGYIADTPGFSSVDLQRYEVILKDQLQYCFAEFEEYIGKCKFTGCSHTCEKGCAVIEAVKAGKIAPSRHENYCTLYNEAKNIKEWELK